MVSRVHKPYSTARRPSGRHGLLPSPIRRRSFDALLRVQIHEMERHVLPRSLNMLVARNAVGQLPEDVAATPWLRKRLRHSRQRYQPICDELGDYPLTG